MNVVITGAGKGIGFELVKKFLKSDVNVVAVSRNIENLETLQKENLFIASFDLSGNDFSGLVKFIIEQLNTVDILINNAGLLVNKPFLELTGSDFDNIFNVNVKAAFKLSKELTPVMKPHSHIVNISSMGGVQGSIKFPGLSLYSAAKGALAVLSESMALELSEREISVNALALGAVQTEMLSQAFPGYKAPLNPEEMADFIYDFAVNGNKYFNGKILPVSLSTP